MEESLKQFIKDISTKSDLIYYLEEISKAQEAIFEEPNIALSEKLEGEVDRTIEELIKNQEARGRLKSRSEQSEFLKEVKNNLQELPDVKLTIAFSPSPEFLDEINAWLKNQIGEELVLDITVEPEIVGGAIVEYKGRYFSFRLDKKIDEILAEEKY